MKMTAYLRKMKYHSHTEIQARLARLKAERLEIEAKNSAK